MSSKGQETVNTHKRCGKCLDVVAQWDNELCRLGAGQLTMKRCGVMRCDVSPGTSTSDFFVVMLSLWSYHVWKKATEFVELSSMTIVKLAVMLRNANHECVITGARL